MNKQSPSGLIIPVDFGKKDSPAPAPAAEEGDAFTRLRAVIFAEEHSDVSLMDMIAQAAVSPGGAALAHVLASHARDILHAATEEDVSYAEVMLEIYRRTFFSEEHAASFGVSFYLDTEAKRNSLVAFLETSFATQGSDVSMIKKPQ